METNEEKFKNQVKKILEIPWYFFTHMTWFLPGIYEICPEAKKFYPEKTFFCKPLDLFVGECYTYSEQ